MTYANHDLDGKQFKLHSKLINHWKDVVDVKTEIAGCWRPLSQGEVLYGRGQAWDPTAFQWKLG